MSERRSIPLEWGLVSGGACFLFFVFLAANGGYGGQIFFWLATVVSPIVGVCVCLLARLSYRPAVIVGAAIALVIAVPILGYLMLLFALSGFDRHFLAIDTCLDRGGRWNAAIQRCEEEHT
jgi:hypothetical protein